MSSVRILVGDVRARLADLPDGCAQVCVTSPPYFGLRSYKTKPVIWALTDEQRACEHEWLPAAAVISGGGYSAKSTLAGFTRPDTKGRIMNDTDKNISSGTCARCGAWRGELGSEPSLDRYVAHIVAIFREVKRVLRDDGTLWLNMGDSYAAQGISGLGTTSGHGKFKGGAKHDARQRERHLSPGLKPKDLMLVPFRVALALQADGWWVRSDIIWSKKAPMPESVTDRPTRAHEYIFLLSKSARYFYDGDAIREPYNLDSIGRYQYEIQGPVSGFHQPNGANKERGNVGISPNPAGRNARTVWHLSPEAFPEAHFATFPTEVPRRAILAGSSERGCCAVCSAPWRRVVARQRTGNGRVCPGDEASWESRRNGQGRTLADDPVSTSGLHSQYFETTTQTTDWRPGCTCTTDAPPVPCTVLDIFSGSGTTGVVASRLGRDYIGIELSPIFAAMSEKRIREEGSPLFSGVATEEPDVMVPEARQMAFV